MKFDILKENILISRAWNVFKVFLALSLFAIVLSKTSWDEIINLWDVTSRAWLIVAILLFYFQIYILTIRYKYILSNKIAFRDLLNVVALLAVITNMISPSVAAASFITILRKKFKINISSSIGSMVLARFSDWIIILLALIVSSLVLHEHLKGIEFLIGALSVGLAILIIIFLFLFIYRIKFIHHLGSLFNFLKLDHLSLVQNSLKRLNVLAENKIENSSLYFRNVILSTLIIFFISYLFLFSSYRALSLPVGFWLVLFMLSIYYLLNTIPIQVFGGIGIVELSGVYLFGLFGYNENEIAAVMIGLRILIILANVVLVLHLAVESWLNQRIQSKYPSNTINL
jgi:uncharacterized protein (TIRG00374 family)